ncbi:hypothetical protein EVAR_74913_1 [Eumeta japonica]|uniref:SAM-dependent MTase RsmB/NOP-type domain-containing protein n=1 Tax=Eumeta variegata TaxID=151549 RepID=A0A4C1UI59_EUMVA|nr:hypothetical protein EVAR_74913_1 [Eumeta japonica]
MFEHSIKVPRQYKIAANIYKKVSTEGGSVKTLLYDNKLRHFRTNVLYALITETIKHAVDIEKIFDSTGILKSEPRLDPWIAKVLTTELLFGKKYLPGKSKPEQTILLYKEKFEKFTAQHQGIFNEEVVRRPRYVRINTNLLTTSDAIRAFQDEGYKFIRCTSGSYNDYLNQIRNLDQYDFTQDYHVKYVFVFAPGTKLHEHELYLENKIILQDKATALAVHLLAPPQGSVVLDMCAAPGMKTTQLAAFMRNDGKIYAIERNENRYKTLCDFIERTGTKCVNAIHRDTLEIKKGEYDDVEYILLDPSCSGSGMELCVHNYIDDTRLTKLTSLQEKFLKHAMNSFPNAKRIVYSTCSLFSEENERVVTNAVKTSRSKWRVQHVNELLKEEWNNFGSSMYGSIGARCLYARPNADLTTGFFLAVLDRDVKDMEKQIKNGGKANDDEKHEKQNLKSCDITEVCDNNMFKKTKKKKRKENENNELVEAVFDDCSDVHNSITITNTEDYKQDELFNKKKKKKNKKHDTDKDSELISDINAFMAEKVIPANTNDYKEVTAVKKKNKKRKHIESCEVDDENVMNKTRPKNENIFHNINTESEAVIDKSYEEEGESFKSGKHKKKSKLTKSKEP